MYIYIYIYAYTHYITNFHISCQMFYEKASIVATISKSKVCVSFLTLKLVVYWQLNCESHKSLI